jgi:hypothetical protein
MSYRISAGCEPRASCIFGYLDHPPNLDNHLSEVAVRGAQPSDFMLEVALTIDVIKDSHASKNDWSA